jgi:hypothetical protein
MATALFVRESLELSDSTEQVLLRFARRRGLRSGDTLVLAARTVAAAPGYVFDLRDPGDPGYLLNLVVVADTVGGSGLTIDLSGTAAEALASAGTSGRSVRVFARDIRQPLVVRANGGAGASGVDGRPGADETFTIEFDDNGHPHREYEPPTPGEPGGNGGAGGPGGTARVLWSSGPAPQVAATGGQGGLAGKGGQGGRGALLASSDKRRPSAPNGPDGQPGGQGLAGAALTVQSSAAEFWSAARAELGDVLAVSAAHWRQVAEYRFRQVKGTPTGEEADTTLALLDLALASSPAEAAAAGLKGQLLAGDNALGLPRNLDVVPDFDRYLSRLDLYEGLVGRLFDDVKQLLRATSSAELTDAQLQVQLTSLDFADRILTATREDAVKTVAVAEAELRGAAARWTATLDAVNARRQELEKPIDWGGVVVVGLFSLVSFIVSVYVGEAAGKIIGSIPDLMVLGNVNFSGSEAETKVLRDAIVAGGKVSKLRVQAAKEMAEHKRANGDVDVDAWVAEAGPVLISFAKFVKDIDEASGDASLKQLVKDLAQRLQDRLAAAARLDQARRQAAIAQLRIDAVTAERATYVDLHKRAQQDASVLRQTALGLLDVVRKYGDVFLDYQIRAARAVEIYTLTDQSGQMAIDRWQVHPDTRRDFDEDIIDATMFESRLLASATQLNVSGLVKDFDTYDLTGFKPDIHYVTISDTTHLDAFRQQHAVTFPVAPTDLAGERWEAKVMEATVVLHGVKAATPTFALDVKHSGRCADRRKDGTTVTQILRPRSTPVQVGASGTSGVAAGSVTGPDTHERPTDFWRRAVATEWTLSIEAGVLQARQVDLSGLTRIDVALSYIALMPTPLVPPPVLQPGGASVRGGDLQAVGVPAG